MAFSLRTDLSTNNKTAKTRNPFELRVLPGFSLAASSPDELFCRPIRCGLSYLRLAVNSTVSLAALIAAISCSAARSARGFGACNPLLSPSTQAWAKKYLLP